MSTVIVIEIIAAILVLAAVVRYAVRDTQRRSLADSGEPPAPQNSSEVPARTSEAPLSEVTDQA